MKLDLLRLIIDRFRYIFKIEIEESNGGASHFGKYKETAIDLFKFQYQIHRDLYPNLPKLLLPLLRTYLVVLVRRGYNW